jgi:hypothetical protein
VKQLQGNAAAETTVGNSFQPPAPGRRQSEAVSGCFIFFPKPKTVQYQKKTLAKVHEGLSDRYHYILSFFKTC